MRFALGRMVGKEMVVSGGAVGLVLKNLLWLEKVYGWSEIHFNGVAYAEFRDFWLYFVV
jgi:hypothetical protein